MESPESNWIYCVYFWNVQNSRIWVECICPQKENLPPKKKEKTNKTHKQQTAFLDIPFYLRALGIPRKSNRSDGKFVTL